MYFCHQFENSLKIEFLIFLHHNDEDPKLKLNPGFDTGLKKQAGNCSRRWQPLTLRAKRWKKVFSMISLEDNIYHYLQNQRITVPRPYVEKIFLNYKKLFINKRNKNRKLKIKFINKTNLWLIQEFVFSKPSKMFFNLMFKISL